MQTCIPQSLQTDAVLPADCLHGQGLKVRNFQAKGITKNLCSVPCLSRRDLCLMVGLALHGVAAPVWATNYVVTSSGDSVTTEGSTNDPTTLRYALIQANAEGGSNTIAFSSSVSVPILLGAPLPLILNNLTIDGSGAQGGKVTIDGNGDRLFFVGIDEATRSNVMATNFPASPLSNRLNVALKDLVLRNGFAKGGSASCTQLDGGGGGLGAGGALFINGAADVTLDHVFLLGNQAIGGASTPGSNNGGNGGGGLGGSGGCGYFASGGGGGGLSRLGLGSAGGAGAFDSGGYLSHGSGGGYTSDGAYYPYDEGQPGIRLLAGINGSGGTGYYPAGTVHKPYGGANGGSGGGQGGGGGFLGGNGPGGKGGFGGGGGHSTAGLEGIGGAGGFGGGGGGARGWATGAAGSRTYFSGVGGGGGFGGGGGGGGCEDVVGYLYGGLPFGGNGGFGGGGGGSPGGCANRLGGAATSGGGGGNGGFGGGGGGGYNGSAPRNQAFSPGLGGFAAASAVADSSNANEFCGGGGAGLGGAIFVVDGGSLTVTGNGAEKGSSAAGGAAFGTRCPNAGQAFGSALFLQGGSGAVSFNLPAGEKFTLSGSIDDEGGAAAGGAQNAGANPSQRGLSIDGQGTLVLDGTNLYEGSTSVSAGTLGGTGSLVGSVILATAGQIAPGDPAIAGGIGTLSVGPITWNAGGAMAFQLGETQADSDLLLVNGSLAKVGTGTFAFHFGMGDKPPVVGATYTLIQSFNASAFSASDFNFDTDSTYQNLSGSFSIVGHDVQFTVETVQSDRIFADGFD